MVDFVAGFLSAWILRSSLKRRLSQPLRRGSNPPPRGHKPAPPAWPPAPPPDVAAAINCQLDRDIAIARRKRDQSPIRLDEGQTQRGNGNGGAPKTKPPIKPQFPPPIVIIEDFLPRRPTGEYQPRRSSRTVNPRSPKR
jgi:hypothetical protein